MNEDTHLTPPLAFGDNAPMTRPADFTDAHRRHWEDAELLFDAGRWANADHLYGVSAECGLKAIMLKLGMKVDDRGAPRRREHRQHMPELWSAFEDFAQNCDGGAYLASLPDDEPFDDWSIHNRYANRNHFKRADIEPHQSAARQVGVVVQRAELELMT